MSIELDGSDAVPFNPYVPPADGYVPTARPPLTPPPPPFWASAPVPSYEAPTTAPPVPPVPVKPNATRRLVLGAVAIIGVVGMIGGVAAATHHSSSNDPGVSSTVSGSDVLDMQGDVCTLVALGYSPSRIIAELRYRGVTNPDMPSIVRSLATHCP
jgi:hypothetical protein